jgi:hypothetical protein
LSFPRKRESKNPPLCKKRGYLPTGRQGGDFIKAEIKKIPTANPPIALRAITPVAKRGSKKEITFLKYLYKIIKASLRKLLSPLA